MPASVRKPSDRSQLTIRVGATDDTFVRRVYGLTPGRAAAMHRPARLVVDAHVPTKPGGQLLARTAREAGVPFLVDPETYFLQDRQDPSAPWCAVPFADAKEYSPADLMSVAVRAELVESVVNYQILHGATAIIAPYVHVERPAPGWVQVQAGLWRQTAEYLQRAGVNLPVIAVIAVGWRCLNPSRGIPALRDMWDSLTALAPDEVALAASKVHVGPNAPDRVAELLMLVRDLSARYPVTMWQQGLLGEVCVIEGAIGYECGIGRRDKCDLQSRKSQHRSIRSGPAAPRHVYISDLGRGVPKRRLELARANRTVWPLLVCPFPDCCSAGGEDLLGDARQHEVVARARELEQLDSTHATQWKWNRLAQRLGDGLIIAERLNRLAPVSPGVPQVDLVSLRSLHSVANVRRVRRTKARRTA